MTNTADHPQADLHTTGHLPQPMSSFIGREHEIRAVQELLHRPDAHLVTLLGPGGIGKTRLALRVASAVASAFAGEVHFVALEWIDDPDMVVSAIAQALAVADDDHQALLALVAQRLRDRPHLLVLDNFEQVLAAAPELVALLGACPNLRLLVTSRAPLRIQGEQEYHVPLMGVLDAQASPAFDAIARSDAVCLFVARAQGVVPGFQLTRLNAAAVATICARLDGLPLAIELAAARVKLLGPELLLAQLNQRLRVLTSGNRDLPPRQQTLRRTIDWSFTLLPPPQQRLFARLAVFVDGWTLEAAEAVCDAGHGLGIELLDGLASLLDNNLIRTIKTTNDELRFTMLETIHEYAWDKLKAGDEELAVRLWHARYCLSFAKQAERHLNDAGSAVWQERVKGEYGNLRSALQWSLQSSELELGLELAAALWRFMLLRGTFKEEYQWLLTALKATLPPATGSDEPRASELRARALDGAAYLALYLSDFEQARALYAETRELWQALGDARGVAFSLNGLGLVAHHQGHRAEAQALLEESLALRRQHDDARGIATSLNNLGGSALDQGDYGRAQALFEESLALRRKLGDQRGMAACLQNLAMVELYCQGDVRRAADLLRTSLALREELGDRRGIVTSLQNLGYVLLEQGDYQQATELLRQGIGIAQDVGDLSLVVYCLEGLAMVAATEHRGAGPASAARLLGAAQALREQIGLPFAPIDQAYLERKIAACRDRLGADAWEAVVMEGHTRPFDQVLHEFLHAAPLGLRAQDPPHSTLGALTSQPPAAHEASQAPPQPKPRAGLSDRETAVLRLVAKGLTDAQVADQLVVSRRTVNAHLRSIYRKLGVTTRGAATRIAMEHHLIQPDG